MISAMILLAQIPVESSAGPPDFSQGLIGAVAMALIIGMKSLFFPGNGLGVEETIARRVSGLTSAVLLCLVLSAGAVIAVVVGDGQTKRKQAEADLARWNADSARAAADRARAIADESIAKTSARIVAVLDEQLKFFRKVNQK